MKRLYRVFSVLCILLLVLSLVSCAYQEDMAAAALKENPIADAVADTFSSGEVKVHYIDVGQADSILIQLTDGKTILIDGGNKGDAEVIDQYLKSQKVKSIDYLIATHPHEDHIGSLPFIVKNYNAASIYMPKLTANTKVFEDLLTEIKAKGMKVNTASAGVSLIESKDTKLFMLAPNGTEYDETNEYSAVIKLVYKNTSFLFTGDAEAVSENEMIKKNLDLKADVLKVGHHGGRTSTTEAFLKKVAPQYAIISVGTDNDYGHPHQEALDRLQATGAKIFRTDEQGTIVASSDGNKITINKAPVLSGAKPVENAVNYIGNKNSKVFHLPSCSSLPKPENQVKLGSRQEVIDTGYTPCGICKP
ncbi:MAG: hypothetical protein K0R84_1682 [Clostridia bacterium]|nr:hypothetical protein [Clostridia bacterium]